MSQDYTVGRAAKKCRAPELARRGGGILADACSAMPTLRIPSRSSTTLHGVLLSCDRQLPGLMSRRGTPAQSTGIGYLGS